MPRIADILFIKEYYVMFLAILIIILFLSILQYTKLKSMVLNSYSFLSFIITIATGVYLGTRSENIGIDTANYLDFFVDLSQGGAVYNRGDYLFYSIMYLFSQLFLWQSFLIICGLIYLGCAYIGMNKLFGHYAIFALLLFIISPNFFQFGMNLMRNGMAASMFIMALGWYKDNSKIMRFLMFMSIGCHISMIMPVSIFFLFRKKFDAKWPLIIWSISLVLYLLNIHLIALIGSHVPTYIANRYLSRIADSDTTSLINFFIYGASPIFTSWLYIYGLKYRDKFYMALINTYTILNAIYIQFMGIEDALRFAYLSEFLMPILLFYPLLKRKMVRYQSLYLSFFCLSIFVIKATKILTSNY